MRRLFDTYRHWFSSIGIAFLIVVNASSCLLGVDPKHDEDVAKMASSFRDQLKDGGGMDHRKSKETLEVSALVAVVNEESTPGGNNALKHRALRELERFPNSDEAISLLLREIRFEPPMIHTKDPLATYTSADVLTKMGVRARTRLLKSGLNKPLSEPELYVRAVVLVKLDESDLDWTLAKEITQKRITHLLEMVKKEDALPGQSADHKAAILFNLNRMNSLIGDQSFSALRIPNPDEPQK